MDANQHLEEKGFGFKIMGCAMEVTNELGHGLHEMTYERALCREFDSQQLEYSQQTVFRVVYRGEKN
jgi:GxxExxY protein